MNEWNEITEQVQALELELELALAPSLGLVRRIGEWGEGKVRLIPVDPFAKRRSGRYVSETPLGLRLALSLRRPIPQEPATSGSVIAGSV